jgi:uncharacterized delta-60 repeat protein
MRPRGISLAFQPDGKLVIGGIRTIGSSNVLACVRLLPNLAFDSSFDGDGIAIAPVVGVTSALIVQGDGRIVMVGTIFDGSINEAAVVRYNPNGSFDNSFQAMES